ncbi:MAG: DUF4143 domain-containing protein [bacterium]|nr:DUF4143 domain-containing protein [bacterium]
MSDGGHLSRAATHAGSDGYLPRLVDPWIAEILDSAPAVMITGPRAAGKTTTASRHARRVVRLDEESEVLAFRADPDAALRGLPEPVLLDEWQECPGVLGAVKRAVDSQRQPGRFIIAGSVRTEFDPALWPGTGRLIRVAMHPLTAAERLGSGSRPFLSRLLDDAPPMPAPDTPDLRGYVELAVVGGFPEPATQLQGRVRDAWFETYLTQLTVHRPGPPNGPDPARIGAFFQAYAFNTAGVVNDATLAGTAGINHRTCVAYTRLLIDEGAIGQLPAWSSNLLKRLTRSPKRYVADTGLWAAAVSADASVVMSNGDLLGRLIETFVVNQLRAESVVDPCRPRLYHLRDREGRHEIDVIADLGARGVIAIEIKAHSAPGARDARHLLWLRDQLGHRFVAGAVLHTGPRHFRLTEGIEAIPISALWG